MAKTKAELLEEAKALNLEVTTKNTIAEITAAIAAISQTPVEAAETGDLEVAEEGVKAEAKTAKAGKRSEKALKEAEEKTAKVESQKHRDGEKAEEDKKPRQVQRITTKLERKAKGYRKSSELLDKSKTYTLKEALDLATKTSHVKFDATVELHVNLGVDPRQADQNLRDTIVLPAGTGKTVRVAVFAEADDAAAAKKAGADIAGSDELIAQFDKGKFDFDILVSTPAMMAKLGKYARVLGPKGLMPNPKSGTVTTDVAKTVTESKAGRVEYRVDSTGIVHVGVGKVSFGASKLHDNVRAVLNSIKSNKPSSLKSAYVKSIHLATTMGPSIRVESSEV
jgi:large subunit ribosomal protein L1